MIIDHRINVLDRLQGDLSELTEKVRRKEPILSQPLYVPRDIVMLDEDEASEVRRTVDRQGRTVDR